jgi:hypothetical protein
MPRPRDYADQQSKQGSIQGLDPSILNRAKTVGNAWGMRSSAPIDVFNSDEDLKWASAFGGQEDKFNTYYDYYYSGQDIQVYIDGADSSSTGGIMPIISFAFNIKQEKMPLYGFWSYTFDAIMRGNRIINGAFTVATTSLNYMRDMIQDASTTRQEGKGSVYPIRNLDGDEENIQKYWSINVDSSSSADNDSRNIWSSHPAFNFVVVYGMQDVSVADYDTMKMKRLTNPQKLLTDTNDRLVSETLLPTRYVIENVELTSLQVEYTPDGQPLGETYSFIARDLFTYQEKDK